MVKTKNNHFKNVARKSENGQILQNHKKLISERKKIASDSENDEAQEHMKNGKYNLHSNRTSTSETSMLYLRCRCLKPRCIHVFMFLIDVN